MLELEIIKEEEPNVNPERSGNHSPIENSGRDEGFIPNDGTLDVRDDSNNEFDANQSLQNNAAQKLVRSIFELSPRTTQLQTKKTLRDFAFNKDGAEMRALYLQNVQQHLEEKEYVDILRNDDITVVDEEMNLAALNRANLQRDESSSSLPSDKEEDELDHESENEE